jgi:crotonobetainyl-CoA:carnitine CoA-transferase CaiB-like acyl-CoA transferase
VSAGPRPLEGMRVLTLEQFGAGPYGSMYLADLGAEVIKVENPATGGDTGRSVGPHFLGPNDSQYFQTWGSNKKSVALDLKTEPGQAAFRDLVRGSEAVINNLRGDQPEKLGLDYASLGAINPAVVCLHISAYGRDNERKSWPGFDYLMQAECGLMSMTGEPDRAPARFGLSMIDFMTGMTGIVGLLGCVMRARATGRGCDVDTCLFDVALHQLSYPATWYLNGGAMPSRAPRSAHPSVAPVQTFKTADGWIYVMCMTEKAWETLADLLERPDLKDDPLFSSQAARRDNRAALERVLDDRFGTGTTEEWLALLTGAVPVAPVYDVAQTFANPFVDSIGMVQAVPHPAKPDFKMLGNPLKIDGRRPPQSVCSPLGGDNDTLIAGAHARADVAE